MSKLSEYRDLEKKLNALMERLECLKGNSQLSKEMEFEKRLFSLMNRYSLKKEDLLSFLNSPFGLFANDVSEQKTADGGREGKARKAGRGKPFKA